MAYQKQKNKNRTDIISEPPLNTNAKLMKWNHKTMTLT